MKKLLVLSLAATIFTFAANAQTERATTPSTTTERHHNGHGKGKEMMKELNLTPDQKAKMKAIHQENKANKEAQKAKMEAILTPEQKAKFAELKAKRKAEKKAGMPTRKAETNQSTIAP